MRMDDSTNVEQEKLLDEALRIVKAESFDMKRCLDKDKRMDALKHASQMLAELKSGSLTPKYYYRLYIDTVHELNQLESFLVDQMEKESREKIYDLYEFVQYAGSIIPRMYLMITVGVVYMKLVPAVRAEILGDLVEMTRGVQHPLRGLFMRNYLLQVTRNLLPDCPDGVPPAVEGTGTVRNAIDFIRLNFSEMNKLWVRMQHQGPSREREKREKERLELRILVGTNLVRLSQLEHLTQDVYMSEVLPSILEQVVSCRDPISQEYLMECVIQVFADEFHLATLNEFLASCKELAQEVHIKNVLIALIDRIALYAANPDGNGIPEDIQLFQIFSSQAEGLIQSRPDMPPEDIVALHVALVSLAVKCYSDKLDYSNTVFASLGRGLTEKGVQDIDMFSPVGKEMMKLLRIPVDEYNDVLRVALLTDYPTVMAKLNYRARCTAAGYIIQNMLDRDTQMKSDEDVNAVCTLIECLLLDQTDQPGDAHEAEEFGDEQNLVARLVHLIQAESHDEQFLLLNGARKKFGAGGKWRIRHTLPPIVFAIYKLSQMYAQHKEEDNWDAKMKKMFVCAMGTIGALITTGELAEQPLKLYLEGAVIADKVQFEDTSMVVYEFISKALSVLEDEIADSRDRLAALALVTNCLISVHSLSDDNWQPLASQILLAGAKMFKKADQVRALCASCNLYWCGQVADGEGPMRDGKKVVDILRKGVKISSQCMEPLVQQQLFIHLLNHYHHFYEDGCEEITDDMLSELVCRTRDAAIQLEPSREADELERHLASTLQYIKNTKDKRPGLAEKLQL